MSDPIFVARTCDVLIGGHLAENLTMKKDVRHLFRRTGKDPN